MYLRARVSYNHCFFKGVENTTMNLFLDSFLGFNEATKVKNNKADAIRAITYCRNFQVALIICTIVDHSHLNLCTLPTSFKYF